MGHQTAVPFLTRACSTDESRDQSRGRVYEMSPSLPLSRGRSSKTRRADWLERRKLLRNRHPRRNIGEPDRDSGRAQSALSCTMERRRPFAEAPAAMATSEDDTTASCGRPVFWESGTDQVVRVKMDEPRESCSKNSLEESDWAESRGLEVFCIVGSACSTPIGHSHPLAELADIAARPAESGSMSTARTEQAFFSQASPPSSGERYRAGGFRGLGCSQDAFRSLACDISFIATPRIVTKRFTRKRLTFLIPRCRICGL